MRSPRIDLFVSEVAKILRFRTSPVVGGHLSNFRLLRKSGDACSMADCFLEDRDGISEEERVGISMEERAQSFLGI